ncbi:hypothetical protein AMATHDRAFT_50684 [Amanita thiersii Skay4041]|uniref:RNI-like protein n=1 Tax=Amanita thiersii Skay4041 TaxID=703135 RepID=A0A2A9NGY9_9AGAR|nr:hypothetical protein AMATHDRAFT_50684 [Amanita thiersii Skay4041]
MLSSPSSSFCSPSSSAVTIPIPGKSILKRPSSSQPTLLSRITRFLPTQNLPQSNTEDDAKPLKRAHFILPELTIVYPISSVNPPSTPTLKDEKRAIEDKEYDRRRRVLRGNPNAEKDEDDNWWTMDKVESFYRECCAGCDEPPEPAISIAFKNASSSNPRSVDFSGVQLNSVTASILSDVFTIEWGLRKVILRECNLDEYTLKPILHSLLIPGTLSFLSVASNRKLKSGAFRLIGAYLLKGKSLQFLDVSQNSMDKRSVELIVAALPTAPEPGLVSLRLDDCQLKPAALEALLICPSNPGRAVRTSSLKNISLRYNRISAAGAVAVALMIRDYPDSVPTPMSPSPFNNSTPTSSTASSPTSSTISLPPTPTVASPASPLIPPTRTGPILPPPRHPSSVMQTTYTPYVPRSKRNSRQPPPPNPLSPTGQQVPIITSSSQGGVTSRHPPPPIHPDTPRHDSGPSAALLDKVRALDALPRLGALRTLDLKGNELRNGISYIAQVLKRNRTLKVLNLSENKLDVQSLVTIAEALKYNSCLETLDLGKNPCCGPSLDGIQSLRTAFTLNTALKRLFLSATHMTSAGAIALAEFLPESTSLLHLDLTNNVVDIAGVMALSSGLKANHVMRCLDLNIPENDDEFSKQCREILNTCVRNTEEAEQAQNVQSAHSTGGGRGLGKGVWGMIQESSLARTIRKTEEKQAEHDVVIRARICITQLSEALNVPSQAQDGMGSSSPDSSGSSASDDSAVEVAKKARLIASELTAMIQETESVVKMEELLRINDQLLSLLAKAPIPVKPALTLQGLGLSMNGSGSSAGVKMSTSSGSEVSPNGHVVVENGMVNGVKEDVGLVEEEQEVVEEDTTTPTTPRIDKGKGRAEPEPEVPENVLSPTFLITESEDEDGEVQYIANEEMQSGPSPTDRSRIWVAEEGEVFRKGTVLLGPEEMEGEYDGEELRRELLDAMVERPPPRPITDEYGLELSPVLPEQEEDNVVTPTPTTPTPTTPTTELPSKPPPKPYISRRTSKTTPPASPNPAYVPFQIPIGAQAGATPSPLLSPTSPTTPTTTIQSAAETRSFQSFGSS